MYRPLTTIVLAPALIYDERDESTTTARGRVGVDHHSVGHALELGDERSIDAQTRQIDGDRGKVLRQLAQHGERPMGADDRLRRLHAERCASSKVR